MGVEPTSLAWEARVMPLYDARTGRDSTRVLRRSAIAEAGGWGEKCIHSSGARWHRKMGLSGQVPLKSLANLVCQKMLGCARVLRLEGGRTK
jgi:hypothetical protein